MPRTKTPQRGPLQLLLPLVPPRATRRGKAFLRRRRETMQGRVQEALRESGIRRRKIRRKPVQDRLTHPLAKRRARELEARSGRLKRRRPVALRVKTQERGRRRRRVRALRHQVLLVPIGARGLRSRAAPQEEVRRARSRQPGARGLLEMWEASGVRVAVVEIKRLLPLQSRAVQR